MKHSVNSNESDKQIEMIISISTFSLGLVVLTVGVHFFVHGEVRLAVGLRVWPLMEKCTVNFVCDRFPTGERGRLERDSATGDHIRFAGLTPSRHGAGPLGGFARHV